MCTYMYSVKNVFQNMSLLTFGKSLILCFLPRVRSAGAGPAASGGAKSFRG